MLRSRVLTALALTTLLVVVILFCPPDVTAGILGLILLIGAWEWSAFLAIAAPGRGLFVLLLAALAFLRRLFGRRRGRGRGGRCGRRR